MKKWTQFNLKTKNNPPRELYEEAVKLLPVDKEIFALDIAAGAMNETKDMITRGFRVRAFDSNPDIIELAKEFDADKLQASVSTMQDFEYGTLQYDFIVAMFALPFIKPADFLDTFFKIVVSLKQNGIFAFHLFGESDEWSDNSDMTFFNDESARNLIGNMDVIKFKEFKDINKLASGDTVDRHLFQIIVKKS